MEKTVIGKAGGGEIKGKKKWREVGGMKDGSMIAWFQSVRQEECGCRSKVITVYFWIHTRTTQTAHHYDLLSQLCLTESRVWQSAVFKIFSGGVFNGTLTFKSRICSCAATSKIEMNKLTILQCPYLLFHTHCFSADTSLSMDTSRWALKIGFW